MPTFPGLTVRNLGKTYRNGVKALDGVNLDVAPGLYGLLGPNGAGAHARQFAIARYRNDCP